MRSLLVNYQDLLHSFTYNELEIFNTARGRRGLVRCWKFSFIISEREQVNPDNSLAECINL